MRPFDPFELTSTERFEVQGRLGSGTSGDVYRVLDRKRQMVVALKTLHKTDPAAIYRFKKEFRALADVDHPNLVQLYELLSIDDRWLFTMELVEGLDFLDHARSQPSQSIYETGRFFSLPTPTAPPEPDRLRLALRQLAEGLTHLHDEGKLHCDIKPSNIRVTHSDRVVLLDFGLVKERFSGQLYESIDGNELAGTPAYMSPEQAAGRDVGEASDWYSVGVVLYEALTGRVPFAGGFLKVLSDKQRQDPLPPRTFVPGVPEDLSSLCMALLARDPAARPSGNKVVRRLGGASPTPHLRTRDTTSSSSMVPFIGRERPMQALFDACRRSRGGTTSVIFVEGESGMGKSALLQHVSRVMRDQPDTVLLTGRCYQRESVPYKALDAVIDALSRYLRQLPDRQVDVLMPTNVLALARLFPALRRVPAVAGAERRVLEIPDSGEQRRRAFAALRELLTRLATRQALVVMIDDLQWGDLDSGALLIELLRPPDPPPMVLIASYRSEERASSPLLEALSHADLAAETTEVVTLRLDALTSSSARTLVLALLGDDDDSAHALADTIARESGGSPFFINELVRYSRAEAGLDQQARRSLASEVERAITQRMTLENLIHARLERLETGARRLLEVVAVAGKPVELETARRAAGLEVPAQAAVALLRGSSLLRVRGSREREMIESYHDRIREVVSKGLDPDALRALHLRLARALESSSHADAETLASHFLEAGEHQRAAELAATAADEASEALAFDRAARLYRGALDLEEDPVTRRLLRVALGNALTNAGRGPEAARAYLLACDGAKSAEAIELRRRAAEQLLISGHIDEGLATVGDVLASIGMRLAPSPRRALLSLAWHLLQLKLRGIDFKERDSTQIAPETLIRIDTCWSVSIGLGTVDTIRGMDFGKRHLLLALRAGEPYRVARALAIEAAYSATGGSKSTARTRRLVDASMALAKRVEQPHARGLANMTAGMAAYLEGRFRSALKLLDRAETILRERCTGVTWELDTAMSFQLRALLFIGDLREIATRAPRFLKEVQDKGDLYAETNLRSRVTWVGLLAADRAREAQDEVGGAMSRWSQEGFHIQHYWRLTGQVETALYADESLAAWAALEAEWPKMVDSMLLRIQLTRCEAIHLRIRAALAAAVAHGPETASGRTLQDVARGDLSALASDGTAWVRPAVDLIRAGIASVHGRRDEAAQHASQATVAFDAVDMELYAAAARYRHGQLLGGEIGKRRTEEAEASIRDRGIVSPRAMIRVLAPGCW